MSRNWSGMQPPDGPPVWTALNVPPSGMPPPISYDDLAQRDAHRHFDQAGVGHLARRGRRPWCPCSSRCRCAANQSPPVADDRRDVGEGLDVVDERRACPRGRDSAGYGGRGAGRAALAFDRGDQGGLLAADERAGAEPDVDVEAERRADDAGAEQAEPLGLPDRRASGASRPAGTRRGRRCSPRSAPTA